MLVCVYVGVGMCWFVCVGVLLVCVELISLFNSAKTVSHAMHYDGVTYLIVDVDKNIDYPSVPFRNTT